MSADNGIYVVQFKDGYRVEHLQAIDNIYWHPVCCDNPNITEYIGTDIGDNIPDIYYHEKCNNCGAIDPEFERNYEVAYLPTVYNYFKNSKVYPDRESAFLKADEIYTEIMSDCYCPICEYGIQIINGLENIEFPKEENV